MSEINLTPVSIKQFEQTLDIHMGTGHSFMLWGSPGVGKSQAIKDWCKRKGYHLEIRMLSQMQPSDFIIPHVDREKNVTHWAVADWLAELPKDKPSVVFLDELPAAPHDVQVAAYQVILDHQVGGHKLPDNCLVVAAGNRASDGAISSDMGTAAADRLTHFEITVNSIEWLEWAESAKIHPYVLSYIAAYPDELVDEVNFEDMIRVSPRSWSVISDYLYEIEEQGINTQTEQGKEIIQSLLEGRIGQQHTANFIQAMKEIKELYPIEEYLKAYRNKETKKLHSMAPSKTTSNYGLIFGLARWADYIDDYIDAMLIFKEFTKINDVVNREENFTSAVTIIGGKLEESNEIIKALTNTNFLKELGPKIREIPKLSRLNEQLNS